ncbi:cold-shock protein [Pontibacter harenae]|uniref:cold-shock protein n=1 Tax=Pontibacter harenae TaxID=2894083 RepID=UPI001E56F6DC|nr:cold shock domain-containing protein [Pontibacter harenae]MCC9167547.1 cold shock domain-containing protein [Pontibacter harenae]
MGRSQETFSKKEKEKKRRKKKEDKEQKKEDRKANSNKGKGIDEMMAYIDDDGNITTTPPDPKRKKAVKQEDIQISIPKQEDIDPADLIRKGTITHFNTSKGYGFIKDHVSQESIFVHQNSIDGAVKENDKVTFEVEKGLKGLNAVNVKLAE